MSDAFDLGLRLNVDSENVAKDLSALDDEKMALESIYCDAFTEKLSNKSWELKFFLPHLLKYLPAETGAAAKRTQVSFY
jgi:hypothetical protein